MKSNLFMYVSTLISLAVLPMYGCQQTDPAGIQTPEKTVQKMESSDGAKNSNAKSIGSFEQTNAVMKKDLAINELDTSAVVYGDHHSLQIVADTNIEADFVEFAVCSTENPDQCSPSKEAPGVFVLGDTEIPNPPDGKLAVFVRACSVDLNSQKICGDWSKDYYHQKNNTESEVASILVDKYLSEKAARSDCNEIFQHIEQFSKTSAAKQNADLSDMITNLLRMGKDLTCELILSEHISQVETIIKESQNSSLSLAENDSPSTLGIVILSLGSATVLSSIAAWVNAERGIVVKGSKTDGNRIIEADVRVKNEDALKKILRDQQMEVRQSLDTDARIDNPDYDNAVKKSTGESVGNQLKQYDGLAKAQFDTDLRRLKAKTEVSGKAKVAGALGAVAAIVGGVMLGLTSSSDTYVENIGNVFQRIKERKIYISKSNNELLEQFKYE